MVEGAEHAADDIQGWEKQCYDQAFDTATEYLCTRRELDPNFTIDLCSKMLKTLYSITNQFGDKGAAQENKERGTIAAYEIFLVDWKEQEAKKTTTTASQ